MKKSIFFLIIVSSAFSVAQQTKTDSLSALLDATESNSEKAKLLLKRSKSYASILTIEPYNDAATALNLAVQNADSILQMEALGQLSMLTYKAEDFNKSLAFDQKILQIAESQSNFLVMTSALKSISRCQKSLGNTKQAVESAKKALQVAQVNNLIQEYAAVNNLLGVAYRQNNQFEESLSALNLGLTQTKNKKTFSLLHMNKGNTLTELMRLDQAVDSHLQVLKLAEETKDVRTTQQAYNNLGVVFKKAKQFDKAIFYYQKSLKMAQAAQNDVSIATSYDNLATAFDGINQTDSILWYRKKAISIYENLNDQKNLARVIHNLGNFYLSKNLFIEAEKQLKLALQKRLQIGAMLDVATTKTMLGSLYDKQKNFEKAELFLLDAKTILQNETSDRKQDLLKILAEHYRLKGEFEKALTTKDEELKLQDSMLHATEIIDVIKKESQFVAQNQDKEIQKLKSIETRFQNNKLLYGVLIFLVFLLALYSFIRWKKSDFNKKKIQIEKQSLQAQKTIVEQDHKQTLQELETVKKLVIENYVLLKNNTKIYLKELVYIKSDDHYLEVYTQTKKEFLRGSIAEIMHQLPPNFAQTHRSYIVNKNFIQTTNVSSIVLSNNITIPLTRKFKENLKTE